MTYAKINEKFEQFPKLDTLIFSFGILKLLIHLIALNAYGLHADELYYIELSKDFAWGFLDISPFVTWIGKLSSILFGSSIMSWRIFPCLFSALTVMLTGYIAKYLGGGKLAVIIACSAIICSPSFLATSYLLQPVVFDEFFWTLLAFAVIAFQKTKKESFLYLASAAFAFGMLNKYTILIYVVSLGFASLLLNPTSFFPAFKKFLKPGLLFLLIVAPNIIWQWLHGFPIFHYSTIVGKGSFSFEPGDYLFQLFFFHGASVAVWSAGFVFLLFYQKKRDPLLIWPISFLVVIVVLAVLKGKLYYGLGIFPLFFAAGGYCWAILIGKFKLNRQIAFVATLYLFALFSLPVVIPVLSIAKCKRYLSDVVSLTGFSRPLVWEDGTQGSIPQFFADMCGWEMLAKKVNLAADIKHAENTIVLTDNYAIAGGLKYYGGSKMPKVISVNNSFLLNSPEKLKSESIIYLSKEQPNQVINLAKHVQLMEILKIENSHLNGIKIYKLSGLTDVIKRKYIQDRYSFYPNLENVNQQEIYNKSTKPNGNSLLWKIFN
ncbi:ArnT family glycosyltransferase [Pedobacter jejuensis]|uniref:Phospholipid carrier-dependent glycosyltransferase n=1 Tax=Pedobacter jejuensis TaxID=1268550 RepID=A0A3N0C0R4_9SPHI|nr:glycosyltransferase family 39 protein [Pedobacter jejuensis]RNL55782.1 phospholipid carrier-dependent glycosyltransferase [Pedobacter jejuensis]